MIPTTAFTYLEEHQEQFQGELSELLRIPSISRDPACDAQMQQAASWLVEKLRSIGCPTVEILPTAGHPVVYGEWLNGGASAPTVLVYGHYDVQYPDPLEDWSSPPFEPQVRDENLYARGASDMKGQILAAIDALEAIIQTEDLLLNIKFLIEGEEEIGSKHLNEFLAVHRDRLASDFSLNTDAGGMPDASTPAICYALRGGAVFQLQISGPSHDLHSGEFGGVVQNPIHVLSKLIAGLHDDQGHIMLPGFYERVREIDEDEHAELARLPFDEAFLLKHSGAPALWGEPGYLAAERIGARPTMDVVQFEAGQPKSAIPARAAALISFRLVPDQDPAEVEKQFRAYLEMQAPATVTWHLEQKGGGPAIITDRSLPAVLAMKSALQVAFAKPPIFQRVGGGIGAVRMLKQTLGIDSVLTGFSLYDDNFHGPNEKLHLPTWRRGMTALVHFFHLLADRSSITTPDLWYP